MKKVTLVGLLPKAAIIVAAGFAACSQDNSTQGSGGTTSSGGSSNAGGATSSSGGSGGGANSSGGSGGASSTGGANSTGGGSGGASNTGGTMAGGRGGRTGSGGAAATGGAVVTGGAQTGGVTGTGGCASCSAGGNMGTGGGAGGSTIVDAGSADAAPAACGAEHFKDWPSGRSPKEIGLKLTKLFDSQAVDTSKHYKTACTWYGALDVAGLLEDGSLKTLISKFDSLKTNFVSSTTQENHVDNSVFGIVPLEIYLQNGDTAIRDLGLAVADHQVTNISAQKRMAVDDMFMITGLQVQAYRAAPEDKKMKYLNLAADTMVEYLKMQKTDGCFYQKEGANAKWGRGNGWFASGMAEMMRELDPSHKHYQTIRTAYEKMMKGLLDYQIKSGTGAGLWYQVIDSKDTKNWPETSGSAMFAYAMITGVRLCILDAATYGPAAVAAWNALTSSTYLGSDGKLKEISDWCYWTSAEGDALNYYITVRGTNSRVTGDGHGQAPLLWAAAALLR